MDPDQEVVNKELSVTPWQVRDVRIEYTLTTRPLDSLPATQDTLPSSQDALPSSQNSPSGEALDTVREETVATILSAQRCLPQEAH